MTIINGVDFNVVKDDALDAAKSIIDNDWDKLKDIAENIADALLSDVAFVAKKKANDEFDEDAARIYMEDQKMVARIRLRSLAIVTLQIAERIWNAMAEVFRNGIKKALGWTVL